MILTYIKYHPSTNAHIGDRFSSWSFQAEGMPFQLLSSDKGLGYQNYIKFDDCLDITVPRYIYPMKKNPLHSKVCEEIAPRLYYSNFTMSFLVTGFLVGLLGGSLGSGGEHYDFHTPFLEEISGWDAKKKHGPYVGTPMLLLVLFKGGRTTSGKIWKLWVGSSWISFFG